MHSVKLHSNLLNSTVELDENLDYEPDDVEVPYVSNNQQINKPKEIVSGQKNSETNIGSSVGSWRDFEPNVGQFRKSRILEEFDELDTPTFLDSDSDDSDKFAILDTHQKSVVPSELTFSDSDNDDKLLDDSYGNVMANSDVNDYQNSLDNSLNSGCSLQSSCEDLWNGTISRISDASTVCANNNNALVQSPKKKPINFCVTLTGNSKRIVKGFDKNPVKKKKEWGLEIQDKSIQLHLSDKVIGFVPEQVNSDDNNSTSTSKTSNSFKVPLKRPPTRPKLPISKKELPPNPVICQDDAISINASSSIIDSIDNRTDFTITAEQSTEHSSPLDYGNKVNDWLKIIDKTLSSDTHTEISVDRQTVRPMELVKPVESQTVEPVESQSVRPLEIHTDYRLGWANVPPIYKGLCYRYVFRSGGRCNGTHCRLAHSIDQLKYQKWYQLSQFNDKELQEAYDFAKMYPNFFTEVYPKFADVFAQKEKIKDLVNMVEDFFILQLPQTERVRGLKVILDSLQKTELSFADAVETILLKIGLSKYSELGHVLINVIIDEPDLPENWPIIRRLVIAGQKLDPKTTQKLMANLMKPPSINRKVCSDVYRHLIKFQFTDIAQIACDILDSFKTVITNNTAATTPPAFADTVGENFEKNVQIATHSSKISSGVSPQWTFNTFTGPNISSNNINACQSNIQPNFPSSNKSSTPDSRHGFAQTTMEDFCRKYATNDNCFHSNNSRSSSDDCVSARDEVQQRKNMVYNRKGLQYDPLRDYGPPQKIKRTIDRERERTNPQISSNVPSVRRTHQVKELTFGNPRFNSKFILNVSLHNLYLEKIDNLSMDEEDVLKLNDVVKTGDGRTFLDLLDKYKRPLTIHNFITMTLAHLKGMNGRLAAMYQDLLVSIEKEMPDYDQNRDVRVVLEVLTMNLLVELNRRIMFKEASALFERFWDLDSLITSRLFFKNKVLSVPARYLFIATILASHKPEVSYEILRSLHLLESSAKWPYYPVRPVEEIVTCDKESRNALVTKLLQTGYILNMQIAIELYKMNIWNFDTKPYFEPMVKDLIAKQSITHLKQILPFLESFSNLMSKDILREYLLCLYNQNKNITTVEAFRVLEVCINKGIYHLTMNPRANQHVIHLKTNMFAHEVELIVLYYFYKITESGILPPTNPPLVFDIGLSNSVQKTSFDNYQSYNGVKTILTQILKEKFSINGQSVTPTRVTVSKVDMLIYLDGNNPNESR